VSNARVTTLAQHFDAGGWGMYPILWCSVILVAITIERLLYLGSPRSRSDELVAAVNEHLRVGDVGGALAIAVHATGPAARLASIAVRHSLMPIPVIEQAITSHAELELAPFRQRIGALRAIVAVSTLFGLLGTLLGLTTGFGCANADAASRATMLARGISEAMSCTAFGLFVSMCAFGAATVLSSEADRLADEVNATAQELRNRVVEHRAVLRWNGLRAPLERATYRSC